MERILKQLPFVKSEDVHEPEGKPTRRITIPDDWHAAFQAREEKLDMKLSEFIRAAAAEKLPRRERTKLSEIVETRGRPK